MLRDVPGQQFVDAVGLVIGNVRKYIFQVGAWVDAIHLARADQAIHCGGSLATAVRASEHEIAPAEGEFAFILPISGKKLKSIIVGMRYMVAASRFETSSNAAAAWCMSKLTLA